MAISTGVALIISAVVAAASAGYSAYSQQQAGEARKEEAEENAIIAEQNAQAAEDKAKYDEEMHRQKVKKLLKSQRALFGGSGVEMEGSPMMVQADTANQGEMDALAIRKGGSVAAAEQRSMANLYRMQGRNAKSTAYAQSYGTMLSAGSSLLRSSV